MADRSVNRFVTFAWGTLGITVLVILWGAVVRATGSGAGCGSHWPLCNGEAVPPSPTVSTTIEYVHRLTSGIAMLLAVGLVVWARRVFASGHRARVWAGVALAFMLIEAAIGAGLVLLGLVEDNASALRAGYIGGHLVNTMFLVGSMTAVVWWARQPVEAARSPRRGVGVVTAALAGLILVAASGAIVALGDTLFPSESLVEGMRADFDPTAHFLIRLRVWHPVIATVVAAGIAAIAWRHPVLRARVSATARKAVLWLVAGQTTLGVVTLLALAPLPLQLAHLLMSNLLWIAVVWTWWSASADSDG